MKNARSLRAAVLPLLALFALAPRPARGEGQNKVQYHRFEWKVYKSPHFDIYHYPGEAPLLESVLSDAESAYKDISEYLGHEPPFRIPLIYYRTHAEFEETNVELGFIPDAVGGFTDTLRNRVVVPMDQSADARYRLVRHELTHVFENSIIYEQSIGRIIRGRAPLWIMEGLAEHIAKMAGKDPLDDMYLRDAALNDLVPSVKDLDQLGFMTYRIGEAVFDYIRDEKGKEAVANFLWEYRRTLVGGSLDKAVKDAFGQTVPEFDQGFRRWLRKKYLPLAVSRDEPLDYGPEIRWKDEQGARGPVYISPALSPSGDLIAAITNRRFAAIDVVVMSAKNGKVLHTLTPRFTNRWDGLVLAGFQGNHDLGWSPDGNLLAFMVRHGAWRELIVARADGRGYEKRIRLGFQGEPLANAQSPAFSPDGRKLAFSANFRGQVDLFAADLEAREITRLTDDPNEDRNPRWAKDGKSLLYDAKVGGHEKLFTVDAADPTRRTQLTFGDSDDLMPSYTADGGGVLYSSATAPDFVFDLYRLDLATGSRKRLSRTVSGVFAAAETGQPAPAPSILKPADRGPLSEKEKRGETTPEAKDKDKDKAKDAEKGKAAAAPAPAAAEGAPGEIVFATFYRGTFSIVRGDRFKVFEELPAATGAETRGETGSFTPPIRLAPESEKVEAYRPLAKSSWAVEFPNIQVGVYNDGTVVYSGSVDFADVLGDQRISVTANSVSGFTNLDALYLNQSRRLNWGAGLYDEEHYYYVVRAEDGAIVRLSDHDRGAYGFGRYSLSRRFRVEAGAGYANRSAFQFAGFELDPVFGLASVGADKSVSGPFAIAGVSYDSARYSAPAWPIQGAIADLSVRKGLGSKAEYTRYELSLRKYQNVAGRSLLAWRGVYRGGRGRDLDFIGLGGFNTLRGYNYSEFFGHEAFFSNLEFRLPLADHVVLPWLGGLDLRGLRLALFFDAGSAWLRGDALLRNDTGVKGRLFVDPEGDIASCYAVASGRLVPLNPLPPACAFHEWRFWAPGKVGRQLQDGRASYGFDWSFFLGPLELHWDYARRWDGRRSGGGFGTDFYIGYTW